MSQSAATAGSRASVSMASEAKIHDEVRAGLARGRRSLVNSKEDLVSTHSRQLLTALTGIMLCSVSLLGPAIPAMAQEEEAVRGAPDRRPDEGAGPFNRWIIRGGILIDGSGAPPRGPVDIVIERNRIAGINNVGVPNVPIDEEKRPGDADYELDAHDVEESRKSFLQVRAVLW